MEMLLLGTMAHLKLLLPFMVMAYFLLLLLLGFMAYFQLMLLFAFDGSLSFYCYVWVKWITCG